MGSLAEEEDEDNETGLEGELQQDVEEERPEFAVSQSGRSGETASIFDIPHMCCAVVP